MDDVKKREIIKTSWEAHALVEEFYLSLDAVDGEPAWAEKQRVLLADMALHLLQTSLKPGEMDINKLRNNLHAILTISDTFLPQAELKKATAKIYEPIE